MSQKPFVKKPQGKKALELGTAKPARASSSSEPVRPPPTVIEIKKASPRVASSPPPEPTIVVEKKAAVHAPAPTRKPTSGSLARAAPPSWPRSSVSPRHEGRVLIHKAVSHVTPRSKPEPKPATRATKAPEASSFADQATRTLFDALLKEIGAPGSLLDHPQGRSFALAPDHGDGAVHSNYGLQVPLESGHTARHVANLVVELEGGRILYVDILDTRESLERAKALGFDALHFKNSTKKYHGCLVLVRGKLGGAPQGQLEAIGHGYQYVFGIDEENVSLGIKFAACSSELLKWIRRNAGA